MKKTLKIAVSLMMIVSLILTCSGCTRVNQAEKAAITMLEALKAGDLDTAKEYMDFDEVSGNASYAVVGDTDMYMRAAMTRFYYELRGAEDAGDGVVKVHVFTSGVSMKHVIEDFLQGAMQYIIKNATAETRPSQEETTKNLTEIITASAENPKIPVVSCEVYLEMIKIDGKWKVKVNKSVVNSIFGGMFTAIDDVKMGAQ